jgi:hypothetical protein
VRLNAIAHRFPAGHRLRVAVSPTYWPHAWPSPEAVTLTVFCGGESRIELPVRPARPEDAGLAGFGAPEGAPALPVDVLRVQQNSRFIRQEVAARAFELVFGQDYGGRRRLASGLEFENVGTDRLTIIEDDPLSAGVRCDRTAVVERGDWRTRVETMSTMSADGEAFIVTNSVEAYEGNACVFAKARTFKVPRDLV